jgi:DNA-binding transcriptional LysR family regulator
MSLNKPISTPSKDGIALPDWYLRTRLKMRQILLLVALDDHRNIHKAASHVGMTQPAATRLLSDLERLLKINLFERNPRGVSPNGYGQSLIRHCRIILTTLDHARDEINAISSGTTGRTAIGTLQVASPMLVPRGILRFKKSHPNHTLLVREGTTLTLLPALWRGELDLLVGRASKNIAGEGLKFESLYEEPMCIVAKKNHRLAKRNYLKLSTLAKEEWILPTPDSIYRKRLDEAFRKSGANPPHSVVESISILTNMLLIQESDMLAVMPGKVAKHYADLGELQILSIKPPTPSGPVGIISVLGRPLSPAAIDFIQALRESIT